MSREMPSFVSVPVVIGAWVAGVILSAVAIAAGFLWVFNALLP